jgi:hypothetical protein
MDAKGGARPIVSYNNEAGGGGTSIQKASSFPALQKEITKGDKLEMSPGLKMNFQ